jgi:mono/diheme cytochrome c family protein
MKKTRLFTGILIAAALSFLIIINFQSAPSSQPVTILGTTVPPIPTLNPDSVATGKQVYQRYCANCHGANLEGVPNWKIAQPDGSYLPPPHDSSGHTWHHPDPVLIEIITNGGDRERYNAKMPGFGGQLTQLEIIAVLDFIKSSWDQEDLEYQWWMTARDQ